MYVHSIVYAKTKTKKFYGKNSGAYLKLKHPSGKMLVERSEIVEIE